MNDYQPSTPRVALGIAAVAITAITLAVAVILPAQMDSGSREPRMLALPHFPWTWPRFLRLFAIHTHYSPIC